MADIDSIEEVDLSNCDREPIHIPGSIQTFGWLLLCAEDGVVRLVSSNIGELTGSAASDCLGRRLDEVVPPLPARFGEWSGDGTACDFEWAGRKLNANAHRTNQGVLVEIEPADPEGSTALHLAMFRGLQRTRGILPTLAFAAREIRALTGYDRVMVYRFLPDLSGEVIAEDHVKELPSFLGQRYPASDIPAQARRLYVLNPVRIIVDVNSAPVPLVPPVADDGQPLDLSCAILRSVSPIHLEYLRNMGVAASMSISIVIDDRLWGLVTCHNLTPRHVTSERRSLAQLLAQHISTIVDAEQRRELAQAQARAAIVQSRIVERSVADDLVEAVAGVDRDLLSIVSATGAAVVFERRVAVVGETPPKSAVLEIVDWLVTLDRATWSTTWSSRALGSDAPQFAVHHETAAGLMAINFSPSASGWLLWFRPEIEQTVRWGGDPRKSVAPGPHGARLTPRGSFDLYIETVRGQSEEWSAADREVADNLRGALVGVALKRAVEAGKLRDLVIGTMGHDLRNPLGAISMAAQLLAESGTSEREELTESIAASTRRMKRLIDNLMELSRIQSGVGIRPARTEVDAGALARRIVEESRLALGAAVECTTAGDTTLEADQTRLEQVFSNLIGNASQHGEPGSIIHVHVEGGDDAVHLSVHNFGPAIPDEFRAHLFDAYSGTSVGTSRGLGLGLYIVHRIVQAHGGTIDVTSTAEEGTTFRLTLPRHAGSSKASG